MSILQEYEQIRRDIGEEKYRAIEEYLSLHPELFLSDIYYEEAVWDRFEAWYNGRKVLQMANTTTFSVVLKAYESRDCINYVTTDAHEAWCKYHNLKSNLDDSKHISLELTKSFTALTSDGHYEPCREVMKAVHI